MIIMLIALAGAFAGAVEDIKAFCGPDIVSVCDASESDGMTYSSLTDYHCSPVAAGETFSNVNSSFRLLSSLFVKQLNAKTQILVKAEAKRMIKHIQKLNILFESSNSVAYGFALCGKSSSLYTYAIRHIII